MITVDTEPTESQAQGTRAGDSVAFSVNKASDKTSAPVDAASGGKPSERSRQSHHEQAH